MNVDEFYNSQSEDVKARLRACKSEEEMLKVLEEENIELDPEVLEEVGGGHFHPGDRDFVLDNRDVSC